MLVNPLALSVRLPPMKEMFKSYGGTVAVVLVTLVVVGFLLPYAPKFIADRLPKY